MTREITAPVTLADAESYFATRLRADAWRAATVDERSQALALAVALLEAACRFEPDATIADAQGNPTWRPRIDAAFCEEALWLLQRTEPQGATLRALGVTRATVGGIEASFSREDAQGLVCPMARQLVGRLGYFEPDSAQGGAFSSTPLAI